MTRKGLLLFAAALLLGSTAVAQDDAGHQHDKRHHNMPTFADVDADGDGMISADELGAMHAKRMAERAKQGGKLQHAGKACKFEEIDADADGKVSPDEFAAHHEEMRQHRRHRHQKRSQDDQKAAGED